MKPLRNWLVPSKLNANSGFWQIRLAIASRLLTTFITPFGRFCFNKLPFGISSASEHFPKSMCEILKGILCQMDDVLVFGQNYEEHDVRLDTALRRIQATGAMLNKEKCVFRMECVKFLGHIIKGDGISADSEKTEAVFKMPAPDNITELRRWSISLANSLPTLHRSPDLFVSCLAPSHPGSGDRRRRRPFCH